MFESHEKTAVSIAIVCLAVCVRVMMNKAGMRGTIVHYIITNLFFCSLLVEDVYTFNDAEAVWQAEAVKVMQSGEW